MLAHVLVIRYFIATGTQPMNNQMHYTQKKKTMKIEPQNLRQRKQMLNVSFEFQVAKQM